VPVRTQWAASSSGLQVRFMVCFPLCRDGYGGIMKREL
jgi:hypothetical protein